MITATPQLSVATALPMFIPVAIQVPALVLAFTAGGHSIAGGMLSTTVMIWLQLPDIPFTSVTVHVTVVNPLGKADGALFVTVAIPQLSAELAVPGSTLLAVHCPVIRYTVLAGGQTIVGL